MDTKIGWPNKFSTMMLLNPVLERKGLT